jgi:hypothetical protein
MSYGSILQPIETKLIAAKIPKPEYQILPLINLVFSGYRPSNLKLRIYTNKLYLPLEM